MESLKASILGIKMDSSLIGLLQVMADVKEAGSLECISKVTDFSVGSSETSEPIVGHTNGGNVLSLAAVLKDSFTEHSNLLNDVSWLSIWVWAWENVSVVKENNFDSFNNSLMDSKRDSSTDINMNVVNVFNARWIISKIASLSLSVPLVVR